MLVSALGRILNPTSLVSPTKLVFVFTGANVTVASPTFTFTLDQGGRENATDATKGITITEGQLSFTYVGDKGYENSVFAQEKTLS